MEMYTLKILCGKCNKEMEKIVPSTFFDGEGFTERDTSYICPRDDVQVVISQKWESVVNVTKLIQEMEDAREYRRLHSEG